MFDFVFVIVKKKLIVLRKNLGGKIILNGLLVLKWI